MIVRKPKRGPNRLVYPLAWRPASMSRPRPRRRSRDNSDDVGTQQVLPPTGFRVAGLADGEPERMPRPWLFRRALALIRLTCARTICSQLGNNAAFANVLRLRSTTAKEERVRVHFAAHAERLIGGMSVEALCDASDDADRVSAADLFSLPLRCPGKGRGDHLLLTAPCSVHGIAPAHLLGQDARAGLNSRRTMLPNEAPS